MKKAFLSILPLLVLTLLSLTILSCEEKVKPSETEAQVSLFFGVANQISVGTVPLSKAITASLEDAQISNVWVLQFNGNILVKKIYIGTITPPTAGKGPEVLVNLVYGKNQEFHFVANTNDALFASDTDYKVGTYMLTAFNALSISTTNVTANHIPMIGSVKTNVDESTTEIGLAVPTPMHRLYAKVVVKYDIAAHLRYNVSQPTDKWLKMVEVSLVNVPTTIPLKRATELLAEPQSAPTATTKSTAIPSTTDVVTDNTLVFYLPQNAGGSFTSANGYYKEGVKGTSKPPVSYIELKTLHNPGGAGATTEKTVVYKVYLGHDAIDDYNVLSNYAYTITVPIMDVDTDSPNVIVTP